jgi:hypothetical protein
VNASDSADPILPPPQGPARREDAEVPPEVIRANVVTAFICSPLLLELAQLKMDHIATLLALAVEGLVQNAAFKLLALAYSHQEAEAIWTSWAPHFTPPSDHPLTGGMLLRDTVLLALCTPYPIAKHVREAAAILVNALAAAMATQTFVDRTAADLLDEEMEVNIHHSRFPRAWAYLPLFSHSPSGTCSIPCLNPPGETPTEDLGRRRERHTATSGQAHAMALSIGLAQHALYRLATLANATRLAITTFITHTGHFGPLDAWPLPCNWPTKLPPHHYIPLVCLPP